MKAENTLEKSAEQVQKVEDKKCELQEQIEKDEAERKEAQATITEVTQQKEEAMEGEFKQLEEAEKECSKELVKINSVWENKKKTLADESKGKGSLNKQVSETDSSITQLGEQLSEAQAEFGAEQAKVDAKQKDLENAQQQLQDLAAGIASSADEEGEGKTIVEALATKQAEAQTAARDAQKATMTLKHLKTACTKVEKELKGAQKELGSLEADTKKVTKEVEKAQSKLGSLSFDHEREGQLAGTKQQLETTASELQDQVQRLNAQLQARMDFRYSDPCKKFDRRKVKGVVAKLMSLNDPRTASALEVAAGSKLYQVVVDTAETSKMLLDKGKLRARVTIIPLDKIKRSTIEPAKCKLARQIAGKSGGMAESALSLVGCKEEVQAAMDYVFGRTLVCDTLDVAKQVTFHRDIKLRSVTLEGDSFDPSGSLSGGARRKEEPVLQKLQKLTECSTELGRVQQQLTQVNRELHDLTSASEEHAELSQQLELKQHEAQILQQRLGESKHGQLTGKLSQMKEDMSKAEETVEEAKETKKNSEEACKELKQQMKEQEAARKKQTSALEKAIVKARSSLQAVTKGLKEKKKGEQMLRLEAEQLQQERKQLVEQLEGIDSAIEKLTAEATGLEEKVGEKRAQYEQARVSLQEKQDELAACDERLKSLVKADNKLGKKIASSELELKKLEQKLNKMNKERSGAKSYVADMLAAHSWIAQEKQFFGRAHTDYDFDARDVSGAQKRLKELRDENAVLTRKINKKVMGMIEKAEQEYEQLISKRTIIQNDRAKIERVIGELDERKKEALEKTWVKVNKSFGQIFSELLPGTSAKLEIPEGCTLQDGLRVMVAFGEVWKQSLTELSGGQRSLLALSLILALLLFKPAPMYILDEVDAALDLSHTQNIGQMLRNHFSHSQFIVVSLKEGMFNNANVVFRTKFVEGVSTVSRTVGNGRVLTANENSQNASKGKSAKSGGRRKKSKVSGAGAGAVAVGQEN